ncbi:MAG: hypothetical protein WC209_18715 [Ignavibacteriaceae bacterium]|jgi:hypothetical protein
MIHQVPAQRWRDIASGKIKIEFQSLAVKIMMTRILNNTKANSSAENIQRCAEEVQLFFRKNEKFAQADLIKIIEGK